jgi:hypothetical protein
MDMDGDGDGSGTSASSASSSASSSNPFSNAQVQSDLSQLLTDLQNAIQSYGSTAQSAAVASTTQVAA